MARVVCKNCNRKKGLLEVNIIEGWHRCSKCGPICNKCDVSSGIMGLGKKKCPICGRKLVSLDK